MGQKFELSIPVAYWSFCSPLPGEEEEFNRVWRAFSSCHQDTTRLARMFVGAPEDVRDTVAVLVSILAKGWPWRPDSVWQAIGSESRTSDFELLVAIYQRELGLESSKRSAHLHRGWVENVRRDAIALLGREPKQNLLSVSWKDVYRTMFRGLQDCVYVKSTGRFYGFAYGNLFVDRSSHTDSRGNIVVGLRSLVWNRDGKCTGVYLGPSFPIELEHVLEWGKEFLESPKRQCHYHLSVDRCQSYIYLTPRVDDPLKRNELVVFVPGDAAEMSQAVVDYLVDSTVHGSGLVGNRVELKLLAHQTIVKENVRLFDEAKKLSNFPREELLRQHYARVVGDHDRLEQINPAQLEWTMAEVRLERHNELFPPRLEIGKLTYALTWKEDVPRVELLRFAFDRIQEEVGDAPVKCQGRDVVFTVRGLDDAPSDIGTYAVLRREFAFREGIGARLKAPKEVSVFIENQVPKIHVMELRDGRKVFWALVPTSSKVRFGWRPYLDAKCALQVHAQTATKMKEQLAIRMRVAANS